VAWDKLLRHSSLATRHVSGIVAAKLDAAAALAATGSLPESLRTATPSFEEVVKSAQEAAVLVLVLVY
jgi:hypothetical protein